MEESDGIPTFSGKVRQKPSRTRPTPYSRSSRRTQEQKSIEKEGGEGLIGKVTNLIVPTWISSWWKHETKEINDESSYDSSNDESTIKLNGVLQSQDVFKNENQISSKADYSPSSSTKEQNTDILQTLLKTSKKTVHHQASDQSTKTDMAPIQTNKRKVSDITDIAESDRRTSSFYETYRSRKPSSTSTKPAFKVSAFMTPSDQSTNASFNTSAMNSSSFDFSMQRSPFYTGGTTFGGASSFREVSGKRIKLSPVSNKARTTRTQMRAKPLPNSKKNVVTSQTAKRILSTLGKMSSPIKDSKRIPSIFDSPSFSELVRNKSNRDDKDKIDAPPTKILTSKKSELVRQFQNKVETIKRFNDKNTDEKPSLTFSTQATKSLSKPPTFNQPAMPVTTPSVSISDASKSSLKMKREKTSISHFSSNVNKEEIVNTMPEITSAIAPFPITSLPKFNFPLKSLHPATKATKSIFSPSVNVTPIPKVSETTTRFKEIIPHTHKPLSVKSGNFMFTTPEVIQISTSALTTPSKKGFAFSTPVNLTNAEKATEDVKQTIIKPFSTMKNFDQPEGSWNCQTCFINNLKKDSKCIACGTVQSTNNVKVPIRVLKTLTKIPDDSWSCPTCFINNKPEEIKCAACSEPKPSAETIHVPEPQLKFPLKTLTNLPKQEEGSWTCQTCFINNKKDSIKCSACQEQKPGSKVVEIKSLSFVPKVDPGSWNCTTCMIDNKPDASNCVACTSPRPGDNSSNILPDKSKKLNIKFGQNDSDCWSCPTCMITNKNDLLKCAACCESKPGSDASEIKSNSAFGASSSSGFRFGSTSSSGFNTGTNNTSGGFKFATDKTQTTMNNDKSGAGFKFGSSNSGFSFGKPAEMSNKDSSSGFKFGTSFGKDTASQAGDSKPLSQIKSNESEQVAKSAFPSIADAAKAGFLKVEGDNDVKTSEGNNLSKENAVVTNGFGTGFKFGAVSDNKALSEPLVNPTKEVASPSFSFGAPAESTLPAAAPSFNFGAPAKGNFSAAAPSFNFGAASKSDSSAVPSTNVAGLVTSETSTATPAPSFNFGAPVKSDTPAAIVAPSFNFGAPTKTDTSVASQPPFNFGALAKSNSSTAVAAPSYNFGAPAESNTSTAATAPSFNFGSPARPESTPAPTFGSASANVFGSSSNTISSSIFDSAPNKPSAGFNFGAASSLPTFETKPSGFNLSSVNSFAPDNTQAFSTTTPLFNFGTTTKPTFETDNKANNMFGAAPTGGGTMFNQQNTFSASSSGSSRDHRRPIKKAVRRKK